MNEIDELESDLMAAAHMWFRDDLLKKMRRLFEIARERQAIRISVAKDISLPSYEFLSEYALSPLKDRHGENL